MRIWLINTWEPLAWIGSRRPMRTTLLARALIAEKHEVHWFTSTFDHSTKTPRPHQQPIETLTGGLKMVYLEGVPYKRNIGLTRLRNEYHLAQEFKRVAPGLVPPDVILCPSTQLELSCSAIAYANERRVPVAIDIRDWWPESWVLTAPKVAQKIVKIACWPYEALLRKACRGATTITGITEEFVDWGLAKGGRSRTPNDRAFPLAYPAAPPPPEERTAAEKFWRDHHVGVTKDEFVCTYIGGVSHLLDVRAVLEAARVLKQKFPKAKFVVCGGGDRIEDFRKEYADFENIVLPGFINHAQIQSLLEKSSLGINPLRDRPDFLASINNKTTEYLSAGLPIVSSPRKGTVFRLLEEHQCGLSYDCGDAAGLAEIIIKLSTERALRKRLSENARALYLNRFVAEKVYGSMAAYLSQFVAPFH